MENFVEVSRLRDWLNATRLHDCEEKKIFPNDIELNEKPYLGMGCACGVNFIITLSGAMDYEDLKSDTVRLVRLSLQTREGRQALADSCYIDKGK